MMQKKALVQNSKKENTFYDIHAWLVFIAYIFERTYIKKAYTIPTNKTYQFVQKDLSK